MQQEKKSGSINIGNKDAKTPLFSEDLIVSILNIYFEGLLVSLIGMIQKFPYDDPTYDKLHEDLDRIIGKFKQLCSLLNVQPDFKISAEGSGLSF
uniref:Uncharacterized protein n=1 Tax=Phocoena sinus TaxID=42100 RepID=A0A8C9BRJ9_PHOSS